MTISTDTRPALLLLWGAACACCLLAAGCGDPSTSAGIAHPGVASTAPAPPITVAQPADESPAADDRRAEDSSTTGAETQPIVPVDSSDAGAVPVKDAAAKNDPAGGESVPRDGASQAPKDRAFAVDGPDGALRVGFDDLDLLKVLRMDPVTPDCVEKMPGWLQKLDGKKVRIRGYMKPGLLLTGIPQFMFVRDTGLCCFGPKGKIYDMIAVSLKAGTTTDYIELRPFDVVGRFKIEVLQLDDDGTIFGLYYIDDAVIIQK